ncbi:MAG: ADP-forming succinate--CoA ligase subunit beta [Proteobacteria bacterium]|nr:ADP-forming succinate--CoA ligase subunit beta [Pseudomonadota bacterium]
MNIHEYQAKEILKKFGVPVPNGGVAFTPDEAYNVAKQLNSNIYVVKAQIHAGGRGKAGGVKICKSPEEVRESAKELIGKKLITHQTGPEGKEVLKVYIEEGCEIAKELYLGVVIDRAVGRVTVMASSEGGMEIEEVAVKTPEKILKEQINPSIGIMPFQARKLAYGLGLKDKEAQSMTKFIITLVKCFEACDCSLAEINPLAVLKSGEVLALDAKMNFDDNALFRHKDIESLRDFTEEDPREVEASKFDLSYIGLSGNIGCMVNGAGLAMATMDIIKLHGGEPANFLDVGGGASTEKVTEAFKLILSDKNVKAVLVNIFGGIMKCDVIAQGIIEAAKIVSINVPVVVRLEGTNVELGKKMLAESGLNLISADSMSDAARKVVEASKGNL